MHSAHFHINKISISVIWVTLKFSTEYLVGTGCRIESSVRELYRDQSACSDIVIVLPVLTESVTVRVFSFVPGCCVLHTLLIISDWQPHSSHSSPIQMPFLSLSLPQASLQCQLCFSLFLPPPHRVLPHSRARRHSGLLIHTDTCGCAVSSSGRAVA